MILKTKNIEVKIVIRSRKIANLTDKLEGKNLNEMFFKGFKENNLKTLAIFLEEFSETEDKTKLFKNLDEVYDFIDDLKLENDKITYETIYKELAEEINNMGFFNKKMTSKELETILKDKTPDIDVDLIINKMSEQAGKELAEEFKGYRA